MNRGFVAVLGRRLPGAWPPSATGRGRGPPETSSCVARTQETAGGDGVKRSETEPPGSLLSGTAEEIPGQAGHDVLQRFVAPPDDKVFYAVHVEGDDGVLAFVGFQEGHGDFRCQ